MADISTIEYRLKSLRTEIEEAGFSIAGASGQLTKSAERREFEALPSAAVLQGELKQAMDQNKKARTAGTNKVFQISQKLARRRELEKQFDKSKFIAKANALLAKLTIIENDYNTEMGVLKMAGMEKQILGEEARKLEEERRRLVNQSQELQLRQREVRTDDDNRRLVEDADRLSLQMQTFFTKREALESRIRQFTSKYERVTAIPPQTIARVKRELDLQKKSLEQAKMGR